MFWAGYNAFTPQAICDVEVPPGQRATWGFDVTLGSGGRNFVAAGCDHGLTLDREGGRAVVSLHTAAATDVELETGVYQQQGDLQHRRRAAGAAAPGRPFRLETDLPTAGDYAELDITGRAANAVLHTREIAPLQKPRPTAHLPFAGNGAPIFVAVCNARCGIRTAAELAWVRRAGVSGILTLPSFAPQ